MEVSGKRTKPVEGNDSPTMDKLCVLCKEDNVSTRAIGFCKECEEIMCRACFRKHLRLKSCQYHTLLDTIAPSKTDIRRNKEDIKCKQHERETVKYYCRKHEAVGCGDCLVSKHSGCKSEFIKDLSDGFQQNDDYRAFMNQLEKHISEGKEFEKKIQENKKDNKVMFEKALQDIKRFRLDINKYLDKVETDITQQVKTVMKENDSLLNELENDCTMLSTKFEEIKNMLNSELYKDNVLFIHTVVCKPKFSESEKAMSNMKSKLMKKYEFVRNEQVRSLVYSAQKLGTLAISSLAVFPQTTDRSIEKTKSLGNTGDNAENIHEMPHIRTEDFEGACIANEAVKRGYRYKPKTAVVRGYRYKTEESGLSSGVAVGDRVEANWRALAMLSGTPVKNVWEKYWRKGIVTAVHEDGMITVKWDYGGSGRFRVGEGLKEVTLIKS